MKALGPGSLLVAALFFLACGSRDPIGLSDVSGTEDDTGHQDVAYNPDEPDVQSGADFREGGAVDEDVVDEIKQPHEVVTWDPDDVVYIHLLETSIEVEGAGVAVDGSHALIYAVGVYQVDGKLNNGWVTVDTQDEGPVTMILAGVDIHCNDSSPLRVMDADDAVVVLAEGTDNLLSDGATYLFESADVDEPNATLFSKDDLVVTGAGRLEVLGNYNDGIASKDDLTIQGGTIVVDAVDDGIRGKDSITVEDGIVVVSAGGDGLKSDNDEDATRGTIEVSGGSLDVVAQGKGIKGFTSVHISGGTVTIDAVDDAIHSNAAVVVTGGQFDIATADDGFHADETLEISGGLGTITKSYEGLESATITLTDGHFRIASSDDGINVAGGVDGSGDFKPGGPGGQPPGGGGDYHLYIDGGYYAVNAGGDGIDSNGTIAMTGGTILVNGPTQQMNGALDYDGTFTMTGGFLVAAGSVGMAEAPSTQGSTQNSVIVGFTSTLQANTLFHLEAADGTEVVTFQPLKTYQSMVVSSPDLVTSKSYSVYTGGSDSGSVEDSLYSGGSYQPGTLFKSFTISSVLTQVGSINSGPPGW